MPRVLITVPEKTPQPYRFSLDRDSVSLGRGSDNDIVIDSGSVSVKHAEMRRTGGGFELADAGSTNGIKLRGVRHDRIALSSGMSLKLGDVTFDFTLTDEEQEVIGAANPSYGMPPAVVAAAEFPMEEEAPDYEPEPEEKPKPRKKPSPPARPAPQSSGVSAGMIVLFLVLAAAAFATGLSIRHQKETGESLIKAVVNKADRVEKPAPPEK